MAARDEAPIDVRGFKGINLREPAGMIQDDELAECINFDIGRAGELTKRTGFSILHSGSTLGNNSVRLIGLFATPTFTRIIAQAGGNLYYSSNGADWTLIGAYDVSFGVQYANKFYMVRENAELIEYDGTVVNVITGAPQGTFCIVYRDRLFVLNSKATNNSRFYFSKPGDFTATGWVSTNFLDVRPGDGDFLTAAAVIHDLLLVFKTRTTWALYVSGAPDAWILRNQNPEIGCISKYTPKEIEGFLYFVGPRGVYKTDGNIYEDISSSIQPLFADRIVNLTTANIDTAAWWDDKYILLLHPTPSTDRYMVFHLRTGGWTEYVPVAGITPAYFLEVHTGTPQKGLYLGDLKATGKVYRYGTTNDFTDNGVNYTCSIKTKDFDFGMPSIMKRGKWMALDIDASGTSEWTHVTDDVAQDELRITGANRRAAHKTKGPGYFRTWQMRLGVTTSTAFTFYALTIYMHRKRSVIKAVT